MKISRHLRLKTTNLSSLMVSPFWNYFLLLKSDLLDFHSKEFFLIIGESFICELRSKRGVSSDNTGMKNILGEIFISCLWIDWIHLVSCSKREFHELHYCSRSALDKICDIYTFDRCPTSGLAKKINLVCAYTKKREVEKNNYSPKWRCLCR